MSGSVVFRAVIDTRVIRSLAQVALQLLSDRVSAAVSSGAPILAETWRADAEAEGRPRRGSTVIAAHRMVRRSCETLDLQAVRAANQSSKGDTSR
jgi:hypothetical protein